MLDAESDRLRLGDLAWIKRLLNKFNGGITGFGQKMRKMFEIYVEYGVQTAEKRP